MIAVTYAIFIVAFVGFSMNGSNGGMRTGREASACFGSQGDIWDAQKDMFMDVWVLFFRDCLPHSGF